MALSCVTADATIYNIYRTMRSDSYIEFHVDGSGNCTYLMVKTYSAYEPKR
jgi:hypothetical protein